VFHPKLPVCPKSYFFHQYQLTVQEKHMLYADPGSGVLIWQLLLAIFFGGTFFFTKLRHWAIARIRPERDEQQENARDTSAAKSISPRD
jgi:hypothetical protein